MKNIFLSIIIPVYNVERYIHQCIKSVINQSYTTIEIILVNDGSTDSSGAICDEYLVLDQRIKVIHQKNGGLSAARNTGLANANGEYVWFVDSDDWIDEKSVSILNACANTSNCDVIAFSYVRYNEDENSYTNVFYQKEQLFLNGNDFINSTPFFFTSACTNIYSVSFLKKHDFKFKVGQIYEDDYFNLSIFATVNSIVMLPDVLYFYRIRKLSIITSNDLLNLRKKINSYIELIKLCIKLKASQLENNFLEKQIWSYICALFNLLTNLKMTFYQKSKFIKKLKFILPNIVISADDVRGNLLIKKIYNTNIYLFYFYVKYIKYLK